MVRLLFPVFTLLLLSCTILEDTDITSDEDRLGLKLKSIQITEILNGNTITKTTTVTEEVVNDPSNPNITKRITIPWPDFTTPKFQFRSGVTSDITLVSEYLVNGKIKFWRVKSSGKDVEIYEFLYGNEILGILKTTIIVNNDTTTYKDVYSTDNFNFPTVRVAPTITHPKGEPIANFGGNQPFPNQCSSTDFKFVWQYGTCVATSSSSCDWTEKKQYNYCDENNFYILNKNATEGGRTQFSVTAPLQQVDEVYIGENQNTGTCCGDKYYFHPYLFMPGDIRIKIMYAQDWWKDDINFTGGTNQSVRFKFQYGQ